jgi:hypothetical protein
MLSSNLFLDLLTEFKRIHSRRQSIPVDALNYMIADIRWIKVILYLSYFYKSRELPIRLSYFWTSYVTTQIVAAFLAYGVLHLRGHSGLAGWRW